MVENLKEIDQVFWDALHIQDEAEREAYLAQACGKDERRRQIIQKLLNAHPRAGEFLEQPFRLGATAGFTPGTEQPGTTLGPYKLLQQIGEGGFGVVFLAEQERPVRRKVALKIIKPGMDTRQVIARFEAERQALAMMDHPNISKVYDAGATENGRPYFVMELVQGVPITEYCDQCNLTTRERLELFVTVCHAVQHAHQKGVIHRDIKPTNVLVAIQDGRLVPKIIDFGVAKAINQQLTEHTLVTAFAQIVGTPLYMSPEQAELSPLGVDTRSDIYSLGVLLYELLTGTTPFDKDRLHAASYDELRRIIREEEPPRPSTRISTLAADLATTAAVHRRTDARRLQQTVRGELDWIVMKCLEKDRNRRYESAGSLARDIERYIRDEPVNACPPSAVYRLNKFIRRNKVAVLAGSAVAAALIVGLTLASVGYIKAQHQTEIARIEAVRSEKVSQFLKDMLKAAGPGVARGRDATLLREILDQTAQRVENDLAGDPLIQGDLWYTLGTTYQGIGDHPHAITQFKRAAESYRTALGKESTKLAATLARLGHCQSFLGDIATGKANAELGVQMARNCGDPETLATCLTSAAWSFKVWGYVDSDAVPYLREALDLYKQLGTNPVAVANGMTSLGSAVSHTDIDEAESLLLEAIEIHRKHQGPDHPAVAGGLQTLGQVYLMAGKADQAESVLVPALDAWRKIYTPDHPQRPLVLRWVVQAMALNGKLDQTESLIRDDLQALPSNATNPRYLILLGAVKATQGDWSAAIVPFSRAVEVTPTDDVDCNFAWFNLAIAHLRLGQKEEYRRHCHQYLQLDFARGESDAAGASLLLPVDGTDFDRACELADSGPNASRQFPRALVKGLAELRRNRFASAKQWADRITTGEYSPLCKASACYMQAIADVRLMQLDSARSALAKGDELGEPSRHIDIPGFFGGQDRAIADTLRHEAIELIEGAQTPPSTIPKVHRDEGQVQPTNDNTTLLQPLNPKP
jgi:serine/threonine protein kinase